MSRWTDSRLRRRSGDDGFSLLEVVVALGVLMLVAAALLPQLIVGIRSTGTASKATALKSVAQSELDRLRNLPYRVAPEAGNFIDLLDRYYPDTSVPSAAPGCTAGAYTLPQNETGWKGFVAGSSTGKCDFEPHNGDFYRTVDLQSHDVLGDVAVVTDLQFLSAGMDSAPVPPRTGYNSSSVGRDMPPASQVGATVTILYRDRGATRAYTTYTQIAQRPTSVNRLRSTASVTTLNIASTTSSGASVTLAAGVLNLKAALSHTSSASADVAAAMGGLSTGAVDTSRSAYGATKSVVAPPTSVIPSITAAATGLAADGSCGLACWGGTRLSPSGVTVTAEGARPRAGSWTSPVQSHVSDLSNGGVTFHNATVDGYRNDLDLTGPPVGLDASASPFASGISVCRPAATGGTAYLSAFGLLDATAADGTSGQRVDACGVAKATRVSVLPTSFAPKGVIRVTLESAYAHCQVVDGVPTADHGFSALVEVSDGNGGYQAPIPVSSTAPNALQAPESYSVGTRGSLDQYIDSWSGLQMAELSTAGKQASVEIPGVFTVVTAPVRKMAATDPETGVTTLVPDDTSAITLTLGAVSCQAMDAR